MWAKLTDVFLDESLNGQRSSRFCGMKNQLGEIENSVRVIRRFVDRKRYYRSNHVTRFEEYAVSGHVSILTSGGWFRQWNTRSITKAIAREGSIRELMATEPDEAAINQPAIGLVATEENTDAVVRVVALARYHNHTVFVTYDGQEEPRSARLARKLGAEVISPGGDSTNNDVLRLALATVARTRGFPGLLFHSSPEEHIDYEQSRQALTTDTDFTVSAPTRTSSNRNPNDILVAIPAYNEASSIGDVVRSAQVHADAVLVVDDGSTDETATVAESAGAEVIRHEKNEGYGGALKTAFAEARDRGFQILVTLDGDGQHDPNDIGRLIEVNENEGAEVVIGSRFVDDAKTTIPPLRRFGLRVVNILTNLSLGVVRSESRVGDTQSGFRAYDEKAIRTLADDPTLGDHMSISTDILYHAQQRDYQIEEVGTVVDYDVDGRSNHNPLSHGYVLVMNLLKTIERTRPLMALALPGFILTFVGLGFGYWGFLRYVQTDLFPMDIAIVSSFLILIGLFTCLSGIILHSLNTYFAKVSHADEIRVHNRT